MPRVGGSLRKTRLQRSRAGFARMSIKHLTFGLPNEPTAKQPANVKEPYVESTVERGHRGVPSEAARGPQTSIAAGVPYPLGCRAVPHVEKNHGWAISAKFWLLFVFILLSGCQEPSARDGASNSPEIIIAAAANLTDAFEDLGQKFTKQTGIRVILSFGGTADLAKQIENGAPFDVFAAADTAHVDTLEQKGLLTAGTRALYARGSLVIWLLTSSWDPKGRLSFRNTAIANHRTRER